MHRTTFRSAGGFRNAVLLSGLLSVLLLAVFVQAGELALAAGPTRPNILFIILDDVGKDQLISFNPEAPAAPYTPVIDTLASRGLKFGNFWTMPECSPTRACFFTGRYPQRTGVTAALVEPDLPVSQVSPYEVTAPRVLKTAGYRSALIGKYHLGGPENNPSGERAPRALGWDYFNGSLAGVPPSIDTTLGGQYNADKDRYPCGFPTGEGRGACWFQRPDGTVFVDDNRGRGYTGQECVSLGGIPALDASGNFAPTAAAAAKQPDFTRPNGYYVWPHEVVDDRGVREGLSRRYMTAFQTEAAIGWIRAQENRRSRQPWMCSVSYSAAHTPYQQPPRSLYPPGFRWPAGVPEDPRDPTAKRILANLMISAMDREIGRLLVGTGLARRDESGVLIYTPAATDTLIVVAGDNGSFFPSVKAPYDPIRSKGTVYQTGVSAPLIVAGPQVVQPGRTVDAMVNCVDLFQLFGEAAGVDVRRVVPPARTLDCRPMLAYLRKPNQRPIRRLNFTQTAAAVKDPSQRPYPCVLDYGPVKVCQSQLFTRQGLCEDNGGEWFGPTEAEPEPQYPDCCDVKDNVYPDMIVSPMAAWGIRNERYKLVAVEGGSCDGDTDRYEFYDLKTNPQANPAGLEIVNLLAEGRPVGLTPEQRRNYRELRLALGRLIASEPECPGDGNLDHRVDLVDLVGVTRFQGGPSVYDFNNDARTDGADRNVVLQNLGHVCRRATPTE